MTRYQRIDQHISAILRLKEMIDCEHVRKTARFGCSCRRCRAARNSLTGKKIKA